MNMLYGGGRIGPSAYDVYAEVAAAGGQPVLPKADWIASLRGDPAWTVDPDHAVWEGGYMFPARSVVQHEGSLYMAPAQSLNVEPGTDGQAWVLLATGIDPVLSQQIVSSAQSAQQAALVSAQAAAVSASIAATGARYFNTLAVGLAAVADGESFGVIAGGADAFSRPTLFRRNSASTYTQINTMPTGSEVDARATLTQLQITNRLASVPVLENLTGTGDVVSGEVNAAIYGWANLINHPVLVKWPARNTVTDPRLTYAGIEYTITGPESRPLVAGDMRANAYYLIVPVSAVGSAGIARIVGFDPQTHTRLEAYGAVGNGVTGDEPAWAAAKAQGRAIELLHGRDYLVSDGGNPDGVPVTGQGRILSAITGGTRQWNTYADRGLSLGQEYMAAAKNRWIAGDHVNVRLFADSTGTSLFSFDVPTHIRRVMRRRGLPVKQLISHAAGLHAWATQDLAQYVNTGAELDHLILCKFGINDGATANVDLEAALAAMRLQMRTRINAIRTMAASAGTLDKLSIILVGPNAATTVSAGYNEKWFERVRPIYVDAARRFQCGFFDTYAFMRDAYGSAGIWMDTDRVHPLPNMTHTIWNAVFDAFFPEKTIQFNTVQNIPAYERQPAMSDAATTFDPGVMVFEVFQAGGGWPFDGILTVTKTVTGQVLQHLVAVGGGTPGATQSRATTDANGSWGAWR